MISFFMFLFFLAVCQIDLDEMVHRSSTYTYSSDNPHDIYRVHFLNRKIDVRYVTARFNYVSVGEF